MTRFWNNKNVDMFINALDAFWNDKKNLILFTALGAFWNNRHSISKDWKTKIF